MKMRYGIIFSISLLCLFGWRFHAGDSLDSARWLLGTWENKTAEGSIYEHWTASSADEWKGMSFMLQGADTMTFEQIRLIEEDARLIYIPTVVDQNEGLPVRFSSSLISGTELVFENPSHDFPQLIIYRKITADSLVAEISGNMGGVEKRISFPMKRVR